MLFFDEKQNNVEIEVAINSLNQELFNKWSEIFNG